VCLPDGKLIQSAAVLLGCGGEQCSKALDELIKSGNLIAETREGTKFIYDPAVYECEEYIAKKLTLLDKLCPTVDIGNIRQFIEKEEKTNGMLYAEMQKKAIADAMGNGVFILTGGPGTGKTTIVKALIDIFDSMGLKVALAAPTGRAAKRMSEATSMEAKTVHRMLEMDYSDDDSAGFRRNEQDLLEENVIIIDEASMLDSWLTAALLKAIKPGARLMLIGDADQLPSVGAGNVLRDIIDSGKFATVRLNEIFRQAEMSLIVTNAHAVNSGKMPDLTVKDNDFFFLPRSGDANIAATVVDLYKNRLPRSYGSATVNNIQVITPSRRGEAGTENLNVLLQEALNPASSDKDEYIFRETTYRVGDRVMQVRNNYELEWERTDGSGVGVFNGDIGVIKAINKASSCMEIEFDERHTVYDFSLLDDIEHAWAITVHKSQGSEYPIVIIPAFGAPSMLLTRNLLYTAVTRAQKMVIIVGREDIIATMVGNNRTTMRYTGLADKIAQVYNSDSRCTGGAFNT
jgi:exodeoxyribonuclease V alpha subunit